MIDAIENLIHQIPWDILTPIAGVGFGFLMLMAIINEFYNK